jgi:Saccharopine dehydrogenase NADP binding domain
MPRRVLIIGGYGHFGSHIARALANETCIQLLIGGRSPAKARPFIARLAATNPPEAVGLDISGNIAAALAEARPDIVIHTTGPFQSQSYAVAEACIAQGCHYIDLADARRFVAGISRYDREAKERNVLVVSGASSVPCLTAAVIDHYRPRFSSLDQVRYGISTAQRTNRGLTTAAAVLSYVGKPFTTLLDGRQRTIYGWQDLHGVKYPELGRRLFGNCDIPDLELFPRRYPELKTIRFSAGLELPFLHLGLWLLSWLVRAGIIRSLATYAGFLQNASYLFDAIGTDRSGFHMFLSGTDKAGEPKIQTFYIIARSGHGPYIPCVPAILLARQLASGSIAATGARPCLDLISLDAYRAGLQGLDISVIEDEQNG